MINIDTGAVLALIVMVAAYLLGYYYGRNTAKDHYYIKGYREGIIDGGKSIQEIINSIKNPDQ